MEDRYDSVFDSSFHPPARPCAGPKVRAAYGNLACWVGVACNLLLCLGKLTVGTLFGSIAIMQMP